MARGRPGWFLTGAMCALPLVSIWTTPGFPIGVKVFPILLLLLAAARPVAGLSLLALLGPLASPLTHWLGSPPFGGNETLELLVLATIAGLCLQRGLRPPDPSRVLDGPAWVFGSLVVASALVVLSVQPQIFAATDAGAGYVWSHLTREYFVGAPALPALHHAAMWLEGLGLAALIAHEIRRQPDAGPRLARLALVGFAAQAVFSWDRLVDIALRDAAPVAAGLRHLVSTRISPHLPDINAMGSVFALAATGWATWLMAPAISRRWRLTAALGTALTAGALWMTHSRSALLASLFMAAAMWIRLRRPSPRVVLAALAVASLIAAVLITSVIRVSQAPAGTAARIRVELALTSARMAAAHPWFGIGLGEFQRRSPAYIPDHLRQMFPQSQRGENAHNQFAQVLGELGLTGLAAFGAYWLAVLAPLTSRTRRRTIPVPLAACAAGLAAFLLSAMLGHPFLTPVVTVTTFVVVGIARGLAPATERRRARDRWLVAACVAAIAVTVPFRIAAARRAVALDNVVAGASLPVGERDGVRYRIADAHSVWLVRADARLVEIPLRAEEGGACTVTLAVDGRDADRVQVTDAQWHRVRFTFQEPETRWTTRRIDIVASGTACTLLVGRPLVVG